MPGSVPAFSANRLTYADDLFRRTRALLGVELANQIVWRLPCPIDVEALERLRLGFDRGPLSRRVVRSRTPGARHRWDVASPAGDLRIDTEPVDDADVMTWVDGCASAALDVERGPTWRLRAAPTSGGGSLLSLVASHVVCDGGSIVAAVVAAATGSPTSRLPAETPEALHRGVRHDLRDAASQVAAATGGMWRMARSPRRPGVAPRVPTRPPGGGEAEAGGRQRRQSLSYDPRPYTPPIVVADCDTEVWLRVARERGGTPNALLVALTAEVLMAAGRHAGGEPVTVALPMSLRGPDDLRSNLSVLASATITTTLHEGVGRVGDSGRVGDLAAVRGACKQAFAGIADGTGRDPLEPLEPLVQLLPDRVIAPIARSLTAPVCLCSNLGRVSDELVAPTGVPATSMIMRSVTQGATRSLSRRRLEGVSSWWSHHDQTATLTIVGMDPDAWPDRQTLREHVSVVYDRWGLEPRFW